MSPKQERVTSDRGQVTGAGPESPVVRHSAFIRYLKIYAALWKTSVTREMSFKGNFLLWIIVELARFALQLAFVSVIFSQTRTVGTSTVWQAGIIRAQQFYLRREFIVKQSRLSHND